MEIKSNPLKVLDYENQCFQIKSNCDLTSSNTEKIREIVNSSLRNGYSTIYLNVKNAIEVDLSGINEIVNTHFKLRKFSKKMILVYKKNSKVEKWIVSTGLCRFIETAVIH